MNHTPTDSVEVNTAALADRRGIDAIRVGTDAASLLDHPNLDAVDRSVGITPAGGQDHVGA